MSDRLIQSRVSDEVADWVQAQADKKGLSVASWLRMHLLECIEIQSRSDSEVLHLGFPDNE